MSSGSYVYHGLQLRQLLLSYKLRSLFGVFWGVFNSFLAFFYCFRSILRSMPFCTFLLKVLNYTLWYIVIFVKISALFYFQNILKQKNTMISMNHTIILILRNTKINKYTLLSYIFLNSLYWRYKHLFMSYLYSYIPDAYILVISK